MGSRGNLFGRLRVKSTTFFSRAVAAFLLLASSLAAAQCKCPQLSICQAAARATVVFRGTVTQVDQFESGQRVTFQVSESFKGRGQTTAYIEVRGHSFSCPMPEFETGLEYLVIADNKERSVFPSVGACNSSRRISLAEKDLATLRDLAKGASPTHLYGSTARFDYQYAKPLKAMTGDDMAKFVQPHPKVPIIVSRGEFSTTVLSNSNGLFDITGLPRGGLYSVKAQYDERFLAPSEKLVEISEIGCAAADFATKWNGVVQGNAALEGVPMQSYRIILVPESESDLGEAVWVETDDQGNYAFEGVQPGRYQLGISRGSGEGIPIPPMFYPHHATRASSPAIIVGEGTKHHGYDFQLSAFRRRELPIEVVWPDGKPVKNYAVFIEHPHHFQYKYRSRPDPFVFSEREQGKATLELYGDLHIRLYVFAPDDGGRVRASKPVELDLRLLQKGLRITLDRDAPEGEQSPPD